MFHTYVASQFALRTHTVHDLHTYSNYFVHFVHTHTHFAHPYNEPCTDTSKALQMLQAKRCATTSTKATVHYAPAIAPWHRTIAPYLTIIAPAIAPWHRTIAPYLTIIAPVIAPWHRTIAPHPTTIAPATVRT